MVLAATNHPWDIDEAFRRRFEKRVYIPLPNSEFALHPELHECPQLNATNFPGETRISLLKICMEGTQLDENFNYSEISERLEGYTGSDIANVCRSVVF